jgi:peptidoglycan/LPS O-acetylase OafA/YrhL
MYAAALVARPNRSYIAPAATIAIIVAIPSLIYCTKVSTLGPLVDVAWGTIFAAVIIACGPSLERHLTKHALLRPLVFIGLFSYSLYLTHFVFIDVSNMLINHFHFHFAGSRYVLHWLRLIPTIGLTYLFFLVCERPFLSKRKQPAIPQVDRENPGTAVL